MRACSYHSIHAYHQSNVAMHFSLQDLTLTAFCMYGVEVGIFCGHSEWVINTLVNIRSIESRAVRHLFFSLFKWRKKMAIETNCQSIVMMKA